jgi:uncharacterized sulfatase
MAGIDIPENMQARPFYGAGYTPRQYVFAARDRADETVDMIRAVRTDRLKFIQNFFPNKPHAQPNQYKDGKAMLQEMRMNYGSGQLPQEFNHYFEAPRPVFELYDLENDPQEMNNLAEEPAMAETLRHMQEVLYNWANETNDLGYIPEPVAEEMGQRYGSKYAILQQAAHQDLINNCLAQMTADEFENNVVLANGVTDEEPAVRFWAAYGIGNLVNPTPALLDALETAMSDSSAAVQIAAARGLARHRQSADALDFLTRQLDNDNIIIGLYSALFIEDLTTSQQRSIYGAITQAQENKYNFTRRVADRLAAELSEE